MVEEVVVQKVTQVHKVFKVYKDQLVHKGLQVQKVTPVHKEFKDQPD